MTKKKSTETVDFPGTLEVLGRRTREAAGQLKTSRQLLRDAVRGAVAAGMSELEAARLTGVSRMTVRTWLGK